MRRLFVVAVLLTLAACGGGEAAAPVRTARITLSPTSFQLLPGDTARFTARAVDAGGQPLNDRALSWTSADPAIATVSSSGLVSAVASGGPVTITVSSDGVSATGAVSVAPIPIARLDVTAAAGASSTSLEAADTIRLIATARSAAGQALTGRTVVWSTSDAAIATVGPTGLVTGVAPGTVTLTATSEGVRGTLALTVVPASVATIAVAPSPVSLVIRQTQALVATARDKQGNPLTGRAITWTSANASIASVSATGVVTAVAVGGPVLITASSEGRQGTAPVTVRDVPVASLTIRAPATDVDDPATMQLVAVATDAGGTVLTGRPVVWTSETPAIATVDATGVFRSVRAGTVRVRARVDSVETTVTIAVRGLLHRWSFTEEGGAGTVLRDDINSRTGSIVQVGTPDATAIGGQVTLPGGPPATADYVELQRGLLRPLTDATIEVWATVHSLKVWSRVFEIGGGPNSSMFIAWSQDVVATSDRAAFTVGGVQDRVDNSLAPFTLNLQHHIVMSIDEGGGSGGRTRVALFLDGQPRGTFETAHRLRDLTDDRILLGGALSFGDIANASYDEVRIHDRVYPAAEIARIYANGPVRTGAASAISILTPTGMRDTVRGVNVRFPLRAVARDAQGRQYPVSGARWSSSDPSVATIDSLGIVSATRAGRTTFTATLGTITAQWTSTVVRVRRLTVDPYLATPIANALWEVPVVLVEYLPTADGTSLDVLKVPDYYVLGPMSLDSTERWTRTLTQRRKMMVEEASRFRGYANPLARPSLGYRVVEHIIVYDQFPAHPTKRDTRTAGNPPYEDWHAVFADLQLEPLMRARTVRELWVNLSTFDGSFPSYDPTKHRLEDMRVARESNMSSPSGDVSNSDRDPTDAPILPHTYIIYGNNFRRSQAEAVHNVGHQIEAMFAHIAQRQDGNTNLFWRQFVGLDATGKFVPGRAGSTHFPPNATQDYDYLNTTSVLSDIEDWRPDNSGAKKSVNVNTWGSLSFPWPGAADFGQRVESQWYIYWMQSMPGLSNRIPHGARWMTNWWAFVADWDAALATGLGLHGATPSALRGDGTPLAPIAPTFRAPAPHIERRPARRR